VREDQLPVLDELVWVTLRNLADHYGLQVEVKYSEIAQSPSARCGTPVEGEMNGWVDLNRPEMVNIWARYGDPGVVGVIAHEMAHIVTCSAVQSGKVYQRDYELLADCLTGDYMATYYPYNDMSAQRAMWFDLGDYEFKAWGHHGTPEQRHNAFTEGFMNRLHGRARNAVDATLLCLIPMGYHLNR
jgi:hypothetical protein